MAFFIGVVMGRSSSMSATAPDHCGYPVQDDASAMLSGSLPSYDPRAEAPRQLPWLADIVTRIRFQLLAGLLIGIIAPLMLRWLVTGLAPHIHTEKNTLIGSSVALVIGYVSYRHLRVFPGISSGSYVLPAFTAAFAGVVLFFFFLRIEYSRMQFAVNFAFTVCSFVGLQIIAMRQQGYTLAIVPGGDVDHLLEVEGVIWRPIATPGKPQLDWDGVVADLRADPPPEWERMIADCALAGIPVYHVKQVVEQLTGRSEIERLSENTLGSLNPDQAYIKIKEGIDWLAAAIVLTLSFPLLVVVAFLIRLESPGPALFRQERVGFRGKSFTVYKFRTMSVAAASADMPVGGEEEPGHAMLRERRQAMTKPGDIRITKLGRFLRNSRIDELPQLINILRGEMSWIGPRPEAKPLARWYEAELPFYHYRYIVRPGITGWAQVCQGHVSEADEVRGKLHYDFYYIKNFSFWLDTLIVLRTIKTVLTGNGAL